VFKAIGIGTLLSRRGGESIIGTARGWRHITPPYVPDRAGRSWPDRKGFQPCQTRTPRRPHPRRPCWRAIADPFGRGDIVAAGRIEAISLADGQLHVSLLTDRAGARAMEPVCREVERLLAREPGIGRVIAVLTAHSEPPPAAAAPTRGPAAKPKLLAEVGAVIAVASGKGGVGKSTVAVNLAVALARAGLRVGLLDADVHGPSLPRMLGLTERPLVREGRMIPAEAWGMRAMSIGMLVAEETAMIWRGPMVMGALEQLMGQVEWGPLDIMIVDMPPGTGDAQLTLAQRVNLAGAVIVSTPQDIALLDARRGVRMFEQTGVAVLGLIENMSFFCCPACGHRAEIFGHGGARQEAARLGAEFLGEIPLLLDIRAAGDAGTPIAAAAPDSEPGRAFAAIASRLVEKLPKKA
jgi:ATP-binding protein involved in chromosome partitioning